MVLTQEVDFESCESFSSDSSSNHSRQMQVAQQTNTPSIHCGELSLPSNSFVPPICCCLTMAPHSSGDVYFFGGGIVGTFYNHLFKYQCKEGRFTEVVPKNPPRDENSPDGVLSHSAVMHGDDMYVFGGMLGINCSDSLHAFNVNSQLWRRVETSGLRPEGRKGHTAVVLQERYMVVYGGHHNDGATYTKIHVLDLVTMSWETRTPSGMPSYCLSGHASVVSACGNKMYVIGGQSKETSSDPQCSWVSSVHVYDITTNAWSTLYTDKQPVTETLLDADTPRDGAPIGRYSHTAWLRGDYLYMFGGDTENCNVYMGDLWRFDLSTAMWTELTVGRDVAVGDTTSTVGGMPSARSGHIVTPLSDGRILMFGGELPPAPYSRTMVAGGKRLRVTYTYDCANPIVIAPETLYTNGAFVFTLSDDKKQSLRALVAKFIMAAQPSNGNKISRSREPHSLIDAVTSEQQFVLAQNQPPALIVHRSSTKRSRSDAPQPVLPRPVDVDDLWVMTDSKEPIPFAVYGALRDHVGWCN